MSISTEGNFTTTFTLPKYQPETIQVAVLNQVAEAGGPAVDPNPVYAELQPGGPPKGGKAASKAAAKPPKAKKPKASVAPAADDASPFPPPPSR